MGALPEGTGNVMAHDLAERSGSGLWLVGIASSAGGVEALSQLIAGLPCIENLVYVVAQHLSPDHGSMLDQLLSPKTALQVRILEERQAPVGGTVYLIPPDRDAIYRNGELCLCSTENNVGPKPSANRLFRSLALDVGEYAIGIVLSGTGNDGAAGLQEIKAAGGTAIAQDPDSAMHGGMPEAAIQTGIADLVLPPGEIGPALLRLVNGLPKENAASEPQDQGDQLARISHLVRMRTSFWLDEYKSPTLQRRIARRLKLLGLSGLSGYVDYLTANPEEARLLVKDMSISVTSFFRDEGAFRILQLHVGQIVQNAPPGVVRCWVAGCASGEEAYSIAILLEEALRLCGRQDLQYMVFASDLDEAALEVARKANYPVHLLDNVPGELIDRYFDVNSSSATVNRSIREHLVFTRQNVLNDPPFSRLDLVSCRNLAIYLKPLVQKRLLEVFHYALKPGGLLFLGEAETANAGQNLFAAVNDRARLYKRLEGAAHFSLPIRYMAIPQETEKKGASGCLTDPDFISRNLRERLVEEYAPPSLVVDENGNILYFQGDLNAFLQLPSGQAGMSLRDLVASTLRSELSALILQCRRDCTPASSIPIHHEIDGVKHVVTLDVRPLVPNSAGAMVVSFIARQESQDHSLRRQVNERNPAILDEMEAELISTRFQLNVALEELGATNENLQSLNEELQSSNEEMQATNEELQTSNEELQSTNEELLTVNEELHGKTVALEAAVTELDNVKESLLFPLFVVDESLRLTGFNASCVKLVRPDLPKIGQSLHTLPWRIPLSGLEQDVKDAIAGKLHEPRIVHCEEDRAYRLHLMPYRTTHGDISGALMLFEDISDVEEAERALVMSESRYRQVTESLPQLVWTCTPDGPCDYLSPQWVAYTGKSAAEQLGYDWLEQLHPDDRQRTIDHWMATAAQGQTFEIEFRIRRHDGEYRWFRSLAQAVKNEAGQIVKWFGSSTDIENHKRTLDRLALATQAAQVGIWEWQLQQNRLVWDDQMYVLYGIPKDRFSGAYEAWRNGLHPDDVEEAEKASQDAVAGRRDYDTEFRIVWPDGTVRHIRAFALVERDSTGRAIRMLGTNWDITASKRGEIELRELAATLEQRVAERTRELYQQGQFIRNITDALPGMVAYWGADLRNRFANASYLKWFGKTPEQVLGISLMELLGPELFERNEPYVRAALRGEYQQFERELPTTDGKMTTTWAQYLPDIVDGQVQGFFVLVTDITFIKDAERLLEEAKEAAEVAAIAKSEFLANMSHEIRTPLNGVLGLAQIGYRDNAGRVKTQDTFRRILDSGKLLITIVNDILDFSKIEAGKLLIESVPFAPGELADEVVRSISTLAEGKPFKLSLEKAVLPEGCLGDPMRISQILFNLLSNAIKFTEQGEVSLSAWQMGEELVFAVRDTGVGIPPDTLARLFRPFEQADSSVTRKFGGTGLGLVISRRLAELMGGSLTAESHLGLGSTFTLRLPLKETVAPKVTGLKAVPGTKRLTGLRLLVAEDNAVNQIVIEDLLNGEGADVTLVSNGQEVLDIVARAESSFDVILMDVQMPVMDGLETTRQLKQSHPDIPVIGQTAHALKEELDKCHAAGMVMTINKPIELEILVSTIQEAIQRPLMHPTVGNALTASPAERVAVDWLELGHRFPNRPEFVNRLTKLALEEHAEDSNRLRALSAAGDFHAIGMLAHGLRSLGGNLCAHEVETLATQVMMAERARDNEVLRLAMELASAVDRLMAALRQGRPG